MAERTTAQLEVWAAERALKIRVDASADGKWTVTLSNGTDFATDRHVFAGSASQRGIRPERAYQLALASAIAKAEAYEGRNGRKVA